MPADLIPKHVNLDLLYPPWRVLMLDCLAILRGGGALFYVTSGYRSYKEQTDLWNHGRNEKRFPGARIVTDALGGQSSHNFGLAVDVCRDKHPNVPKLQPDWTVDKYTEIGAACRELGIVWGGDFKKPDRPHIQFPGFVSDDDLRELHHIYSRRKDLNDVFKELDWQLASPGFQDEHAVMSLNLERLGFLPERRSWA